jgi:hypothetical protein
MTSRLKNGKPGSSKKTMLAQSRAPRRAARDGTQGIDALMALRILAQAYEQIGDRLLDRMHDCAGNPRLTRSLTRHLDWVGSRARVINSFIEAGDGALSYLCAASEAPERLTSLVQLTAHNAAADRLPVALFLVEKIDEELRLA